MAEHEDDQGTGTDEETPLVRRLRKQVEEATAELRQFKTRDALSEAGFDPKSPQAKALMKLHDGDLTVEAIQNTAQEYGFTPAEGTTDTGDEPVDEVAQQRQETTQRIDELRSNAQPVGSTKTSYEDFQQLRASNPTAAAQALAAGQVDLPPYVANALEANRADNATSMTGT